MADKEIGIVIKAKDEASKTMGDIANNMKSNFATMSAASAVAGGAIVAFLGSTISGAAEAESAQKQLEHAVLQVSHANEAQLESTMALADSLERKGVLDGDSIKVGLAQLSTFGLSNDAVQALGGSMADLAVNQFGVNASSDQMAQTANVLAKALNGQFGVLEKSGIRFTEAQQHMIQFGTEAEKVAAINEGLAQNLKYTNEVALGTFEGGMAHLNVAIGNVTEAIGQALFPILTQLAQMVLPIIQATMDWINANQQLFTIIVSVVGVLGVIMTVVGGLGLVIGPLSAAFSALGAAIMFCVSPIGLIVIGIAALTAAVVYLWNTNEGFRNALVVSWNAIYAVVSQTITVIQQAINTFVTTVRQLWDSNWGGIRETFEQVWGFLSTTGVEFVITLYETIKAATMPFVQFIADHWEQIKAVFMTVFDAMKVGWSILWEEVKMIFTISWSVFQGLVKAGLAILKGDWSGAWDAIKGIFVNVWNAVVTFLGNVLGILQGALTAAWDGITGAISAFGSTLMGIWNGIWDGIKKKVDDIVNSIMSIINGMVNTINGAISAIGNLGSSAMSAVGGAFGGGRAVGGPVKTGTAYLVGEEGPEMFVPSSSGSIVPNGKMGGGGTTVNVYVTGNTVLSDDGAEQIGDMIFNKFRLNYRT